MTEYRNRIHPRLSNWNYSSSGMYFLTICTQDKAPLLSRIVGRGILDAPSVQLTEAGKSVEEVLDFMNRTRTDLHICAKVVMPNHVHLLVELAEVNSRYDKEGKRQHANQRIPQLISSLKRFTNRKVGRNLWQRSFYDHIIRDERDYVRVLEYIQTNPDKWLDDCYYIPEK